MDKIYSENPRERELAKLIIDGRIILKLFIEKQR
jgi:hypothetical protein